MPTRTITGAAREDGTKLTVKVDESVLPADLAALEAKIGGKDDADRNENRYQLMIGGYFSSASSKVRNWLATDEAVGMDESARQKQAEKIVSEYEYERRQAAAKVITLSSRGAYSKAALAALEADGYTLKFADENGGEE